MAVSEIFTRLEEDTKVTDEEGQVHYDDDSNEDVDFWNISGMESFLFKELDNKSFEEEISVRFAEKTFKPAKEISISGPVSAAEKENIPDQVSTVGPGI